MKEFVNISGFLEYLENNLPRGLISEIESIDYFENPFLRMRNIFLFKQSLMYNLILVDYRNAGVFSPAESSIGCLSLGNLRRTPGVYGLIVDLPKGLVVDDKIYLKPLRISMDFRSRGSGLDVELLKRQDLIMGENDFWRKSDLSETFPHRFFFSNIPYLIDRSGKLIFRPAR